MEAFSQGLRPHQKAQTGDGSTVLERAVVEHNLAAASRLYANIHLAQLGQLLGVAENAAETVAARMIAEKRLKVRARRCVHACMHALVGMPGSARTGIASFSRQWGWPEINAASSESLLLQSQSELAYYLH